MSYLVKVSVARLTFERGIVFVEGVAGFRGRFLRGWRAVYYIKPVFVGFLWEAGAGGDGVVCLVMPCFIQKFTPSVV